MKNALGSMSQETSAGNIDKKLCVSSFQHGNRGNKSINLRMCYTASFSTRIQYVALIIWNIDFCDTVFYRILLSQILQSSVPWLWVVFYAGHSCFFLFQFVYVKNYMAVLESHRKTCWCTINKHGHQKSVKVATVWN